ncbi:MAG: hypothetical protein IJ157_02880 [Clostridia bacterium]|nr:hypothetical protein [Clostridia bacterium]
MMKKLTVFCAAIMALCLLRAGASANGWGLKSGRLLDAVAAAHTWDEYTCLAQAGDCAVMHSQYHNALFWADGEGRLHVYTTAVYQPDAQKAPPRLTWTEGRFLTLAYGQSESYTFEEVYGAGFELREARIGDFRLYAQNESPDSEVNDYRWYCEDAEGKVYYNWRMPLNTFNISLLPHSTAEARAVRLMDAKLDSGQAYLDGNYSPDHWGLELHTGGRTGTAPVYTAPFGASSWRVAKGKAAVGLAGRIWLLNEYLNGDGETWAMIRYDVSPRTQRIGYALAADLGQPSLTAQDHDSPGNSFARVAVECAADTYLTDDPDVSQFRQASLPRGTQLDCWGLYNDYYAYVGLEVDRDGRPADGGAILWGFVPVKDLRPMEKEARQDVMARLAGYWHFYAGGNQAEDYIQFNADGTFTAADFDWTKYENAQAWRADGMADPVAGVWHVTNYNAFENLYWNDPPYELTMLRDDGRVNIKGLALEENGFGLTYWEGGGGYCPVEDETEMENG